MQKQTLKQIHLFEMTVCHFLVLDWVMVIKVTSLIFSCPRNYGSQNVFKLKRENVNKHLTVVAHSSLDTHVNHFSCLIIPFKISGQFCIQNLRPHFMGFTLFLEYYCYLRSFESQTIPFGILSLLYFLETKSFSPQL